MLHFSILIITQWKSPPVLEDLNFDRDLGEVFSFDISAHELKWIRISFENSIGLPGYKATKISSQRGPFVKIYPGGYKTPSRSQDFCQSEVPRR